MVHDPDIQSRKSDHIRINLEENVQSGLKTGLEKYRFIHQALPEINLEEVDLSVTLFSKTLQAPILISSMTGGTAEASIINQTLAAAAQATGIALGLGSQRAAIEKPELAATFQVRDQAPNALIFANLGAIQLNYGYGVDECRQAVEMIGADALILHLNALQEAVQSGGNTTFAGLLKRIEQICSTLSVPVVVKEVGWGISEQAARQLANAGVSAIDVAGAGGTSWSQVEMHRAKNPAQARLAAAFLDWGIPTVESILNVRRAAPDMPIIASGGLRSGVDIAKSIALGAVLGGMASPFLKSATRSLVETIGTIQEIKQEIKVCMFAAGLPDMAALRNAQLLGTTSKD